MYDRKNFNKITIRNIASLSKMLRKKEPQIYFDFLKNQFKEIDNLLDYGKQVGFFD